MNDINERSAEKENWVSYPQQCALYLFVAQKIP